MAKYQCVARVPPDVTGKTYYELEVYDLDKAEVEKLTAAGHFGATYGKEGTPGYQEVEPHFVPVGGQTEESAAPANQSSGQGNDQGNSNSQPKDTYDEMPMDALRQIAGEMGIKVPVGTKKVDLAAAIRAKKPEA